MFPRRALPVMTTATIATIAALLLAGCGGSDPEEATADACSRLSALATAAQKADALGATATIDQIREVRDELADASADVAERLQDVAEDRRDAVREARESLESAVGDLDGDLTVPEAVTALQDDVARLRSASQAVGSTLDCA